MLSQHDDFAKQPLRNRTRTSERTRERAKELRRRMSPPEKILWSRLKRQQLARLKFRKQHPIGPWIADFYCHEAALVVEIDGWTHSAPRDNERDNWMSERSVAVIRFSAAAVFGNLVDVLAMIRKVAEARIAALQGAASHGVGPDESCDHDEAE